MYLLSTELSWDRGIMGFFLQTSDQMLKISCLSVTFECCFVEHVNINCIINSRMHKFLNKWSNAQGWLLLQDTGEKRGQNCWRTKEIHINVSLQNIEAVVLVVWDTVDQPVFVIYAEESKMIVLKLFLLDILLFCFYIYTASV